jgi:hypothetical protein
MCQRYGANVQTGLGELSITATLSVARRIEASGKPARIFYVSDFDPAGQSMPVAVARKIEYFVQQLGLSVDVRLFPIVLTIEQVRHYRLPRTPIKETERRAGRFEERYGAGAVELDALEALHPGELATVLSQEIERYYDTSLEQRAAAVQRQLEAALTDTRLAIIDNHRAEIEALEDEYAQIRAAFAAQMASHNRRLTALWQTIATALEDDAPDIGDYPLPDPRNGAELGDGLYNSERDYLTQIGAYEQFQGKAAA